MHPIHSISVSSNVMDSLLREFEGYINSKRLKSRITKIVDLIDVLWKRNVFLTDLQSVTNIIQKYLPKTEQREIWNYLSSLDPNEGIANSGNRYAKIRQKTVNQSASPSNHQSSSIQTTHVQQSHLRNALPNTEEPAHFDKHKVFTVVCNEIENWRDFGRCFGMRDVDVNRINQDRELNNDTRLITNRILEQMQAIYRDQFPQKLCDALIEARRKDIHYDF
ncbi:uncharacterized protein LOC116337558 isoform X2 [Contarinia nasturtii]|uniref:uncharacterized protein LOC116337558 isoform X2 n=1 Tax=Contarinia nasturtii TaxID=265458 RepID=UPI0012D489EC|nr:uncharacterized protein LOC116337558 isoform X2 [Contarinia nasturtii]